MVLVDTKDGFISTTDQFKYLKKPVQTRVHQLAMEEPLPLLDLQALVQLRAQIGMPLAMLF